MIPARDPRWKAAAKSGQSHEYALADAKNAVGMIESIVRMLEQDRFDQAAEHIKYLTDKFLPIMLKAVEQAKADHAAKTEKD